MAYPGNLKGQALYYTDYDQWNKPFHLSSDNYINDYPDINKNGREIVMYNYVLDKIGAEGCQCEKTYARKPFIV